MVKRMLALMLVCLLSNTTMGAPAALASQTTNQPPTLAERTRACAVRLSSVSRHRNERIEVRRRDGTKLKGYVGVAEENHFTIIDRRTGAPTPVLYNDVVSLRCGRSLSRELAKGGIILAAAIGALMLLGLYAVSQTR